jgi:hypothetical protein
LRCRSRKASCTRSSASAFEPTIWYAIWTIAGCSRRYTAVNPATTGLSVSPEALRFATENVTSYSFLSSIQYNDEYQRKNVASSLVTGCGGGWSPRADISEHGDSIADVGDAFAGGTACNLADLIDLLQSTGTRERNIAAL